jgi:hypothetical protein
MGPKTTHNVVQTNVLGQLPTIINGDETWFHHFKLESKWQSMECKHPQMPSKKKVKDQSYAGKLMLADCLGLTRVSTGKLSAEGHNNKQWSLQ